MRSLQVGKIPHLLELSHKHNTWDSYTAKVSTAVNELEILVVLSVQSVGFSLFDCGLVVDRCGLVAGSCAVGCPVIVFSDACKVPSSVPGLGPLRYWLGTFSLSLTRHQSAFCLMSRVL